jgi:MFS family permease
MSVLNVPRNSLRNPLLLSFYLPSLILAFSAGLLAPVLPLYARAFEASYGLVGLVLAGERLGMLLGDIPAGALIRRLGQKGTMSLGICCAALSTAALFWAGSIPEAVIYRLCTGFGMALYSVARHAYIADQVASASRGRAIALFGGIFRVGRFAGPMVGGIVAAQYGLRTPFLVFGCAGVATLIVIMAFVRTTRAASPRASAQGNHLLSILKTQHRILTSAGAGQLFAQMIRAGRGIIIPLYAADVIGLDVQAIGFIISISSAIDMSLFYPTGLIMDRLGRKCAIVPSFLIQAIGMSLVPFTSSFVGLLLATSLIGLGNGLSSGSMMTLGADFAPQDTRGEFLGVWRLIGDGGATGGPLVVGGIADLVALPTAAWAMSGAGVIAAAIFALFVPETLKKRKRAARLSCEGG